MPKKPTTLTLDPDFMDYLRDVAWWVGRGISVNGILERGASEEVKRLQDLHNGGEPFPPFGDEKKVIPRDRDEKPKLNVTIRLNPVLLDHLKWAAYHLGTTYGSIVVAGAEKALRELERQFNKGRKFRKREGELPTSPKKRED